MIGAETVARVRAAYLTDAQGSATAQRDWAHAATTTVTGVSVQPAGTVETRDAAGVGLHADWRLFDRGSPAGFWQAGDRVTWAAVTYDVVGTPQVWPAPGGGRHHWEVALRAQPPTLLDATGTAAVLHAATQAVVDEQQPWTP